MQTSTKDIIRTVVSGLFLITPALVMAVCVVAIDAVQRRMNRKRKNPLTEKRLLRAPGQGLSERADDAQFKVMETIFLWCVIPTMLYLALMSPLVSLKAFSVLLVAMAVACAACAYGAERAFSMLKRITNDRLGCEGERFVGQELDELMLDGYRVYHDIQAGHFNIDHAVVGPAGVFAVETKTRSKHDSAEGGEAVKVIYSGDFIYFPQWGKSKGWTDTRATEQARTNAKWLAKRLSESTGRDVKVFPVVAVPGWFTRKYSEEEDGNKGLAHLISKETEKPNPIVYNGENPRLILPKCGLFRNKWLSARK